MIKQKMLIVHPCDDKFCITNYSDTYNAIGKYYILHTTQLHFLSFRYAERLFVSVNDKLHEITVGKCTGTNREIKISHNLVNLLLAGEFDWF